MWKVVNEQCVTLFPTIRDHVLVDRFPDLMHLECVDRSSITERGLQCHLLAEDSVLLYERYNKKAAGSNKITNVLCLLECEK
jgi:hypothetical protein